MASESEEKAFQEFLSALREEEEPSDPHWSRITAEISLMRKAWHARAALSPQWVSVERDLPSTGLPVLLYGHPTPGIDFGWRVNDHWDTGRTVGMYDDPVTYNAHQITHWMLPAPPEAQ